MKTPNIKVGKVVRSKKPVKTTEQDKESGKDSGEQEIKRLEQEALLSITQSKADDAKALAAKSKRLREEEEGKRDLPERLAEREVAISAREEALPIREQALDAREEQIFITEQFSLNKIAEQQANSEEKIKELTAESEEMLEKLTQDKALIETELVSRRRRVSNINIPAEKEQERKEFVILN